MYIERPIGSTLWYADYRWQADLCNDCLSNAVLTLDLGLIGEVHLCKKHAKQYANKILKAVEIPYKQTKKLYKEAQRSKE